MEEGGHSMDPMITETNLFKNRSVPVHLSTEAESVDSRYESFASLLSVSCTEQMLDDFVSEMILVSISHKKLNISLGFGLIDMDLNCALSGWSVDLTGNKVNIIGTSAEGVQAANLDLNRCEMTQCFERAIENEFTADFVMVGVEDNVEILTNMAARNTTIKGSRFREPITGRQSALQKALMKFADRFTPYVIDPCVGTEFDTKEEAYEYYNLYPWECGFGIR
ncbi:hypothetical protein BS78_09G237300 [Paspalum vaginatum]|nr:hypothetical protein BS78_09G237300 [Paspalum vaginatum]